MTENNSKDRVVYEAQAPKDYIDLKVGDRVGFTYSNGPICEATIVSLTGSEFGPGFIIIRYDGGPEPDDIELHYTQVWKLPFNHLESNGEQK